MNKTEESDKRWEGGGKICLKAYQKSGVTVILFTVRGYSKLKRPIESSTVGAGFACPNQRSQLWEKYAKQTVFGRANLASTGKITVLSMLCPLKSYRL